jgi:hypothetical protein
MLAKASGLVLPVFVVARPRALPLDVDFGNLKSPPKMPLILFVT